MTCELLVQLAPNFLGPPPFCFLSFFFFSGLDAGVGAKSHPVAPGNWDGGLGQLGLMQLDQRFGGNVARPLGIGAQLLPAKRNGIFTSLPLPSSLLATSETTRSMPEDDSGPPGDSTDMSVDDGGGGGRGGGEDGGNDDTPPDNQADPDGPIDVVGNGGGGESGGGGGGMPEGMDGGVESSGAGGGDGGREGGPSFLEAFKSIDSVLDTLNIKQIKNPRNHFSSHAVAHSAATKPLHSSSSPLSSSLLALSSKVGQKTHVISKAKGKSKAGSKANSKAKTKEYNGGSGVGYSGAFVDANMLDSVFDTVFLCL